MSLLYTAFKKLLLDGDIDLLTDTIKAVLIDEADYTVSAAHDFLDDIAGAARIATATLSSKTTTGGVFDSADPVWTGVSGDTFEACALYKDTGVESTSPLIGYFNGLNLTPNGGQITGTVDASGWFAL